MQLLIHKKVIDTANPPETVDLTETPAKPSNSRGSQRVGIRGGRSEVSINKDKAVQKRKRGPEPSDRVLRKNK